MTEKLGAVQAPRRRYMVDPSLISAHDAFVDRYCAHPDREKECAAIGRLDASGLTDPHDVIRVLGTNDPIAAVARLRLLQLPANEVLPPPLRRLARARSGRRGRRRHVVRCADSASVEGPCGALVALDPEPNGATLTCELPEPVVAAAALVAARPDAARVALFATVTRDGDFDMLVVPRSRFRGLDARFASPCAAGVVELVHEHGPDVKVTTIRVRPRDVRAQATAFVSHGSRASLVSKACQLVRGFGLAPDVAASILRSVVVPMPSLADAMRAARAAEREPDPLGWAVDFEAWWAGRSRAIWADVLRQERQNARAA